VLVGVAILGIALMVVLAALARTLRPLAAVLGGAVVFYAVVKGTGNVTAALIALGVLAVAWLLVRSINETTHIVVVARREPRRRRRRAAAQVASLLEDIEREEEELRRAA